MSDGAQGNEKSPVVGFSDSAGHCGLVHMVLALVIANVVGPAVV